MKALARVIPALIIKLAPSVLTTLGTLMAVLWSEGFRAFCGVSP